MDAGTPQIAGTPASAPEPPRAAPPARSAAAHAPPPVADLWNDLVTEVRRRPYRSLGIALAAGYVVGGGLFTRFTARVLGAALKIGVRVVAPIIVRHEILAALGHPSPVEERPISGSENGDFVENP